jgi:hypothetical protein
MEYIFLTHCIGGKLSSFWKSKWQDCRSKRADRDWLKLLSDMPQCGRLIVGQRRASRTSTLLFAECTGACVSASLLILFSGKVVHALSKCHAITIPWPESRAAQLHAPISSHEPSVTSLVDWRIPLEAGTTITARWQIPCVSVQP